MLSELFTTNAPASASASGTATDNDSQSSTGTYRNHSSTDTRAVEAGKPDLCAASAPCRNNATCVADSDMGYRCLCALGWGGRVCADGKSISSSSTSFRIVTLRIV